MLLWWGTDLVQLYNDAFVPSLGTQGKHPTALGQCGADCWPENWTTIHPLIEQIRAGEETACSEDRLVSIYRNNQREEAYWTFCYSPVYDESDQIAGILCVCQETTAKVVTQRQLRWNQDLFERLIDQAPVAIALLDGPDFVVTMANERALAYWGRTREQVIHKPIFEALPEAGGQGFEELLHQVRATGERFVARERFALITRNGHLETTYLDFVYEPFYDAVGTPSGVISVCVEVTEQVLARRDLAEKSRDLELAITVGQLGIFKVDVASQTATYSPLIMDWFGFAEQRQPMSVIFAGIVPEDRERVVEAIQQSVNGEHGGYHDLIYRVQSPNDGQLRHLHSIGQVSFEEQRAVSITGIIQDVTQAVQAQQRIEASETRYRTLSAALEQQVQERTQQLQFLVRDLERSNQHLEQFAYVASHDLQEPLRKIHQFGNQLKKRYAEQLGEGRFYVERMQVAAGRMSALIDDLLNLSRIATQRKTPTRIALHKVVEAALQDLDLLITETGAQVEVTPLPEVMGNDSQLYQLFLNLLSNAVKFRKPTGTPLIRITAQPVPRAQLPGRVKPTQWAETYHCIDVSDNGIGFEPQYQERIFQVFHRLHGKDEYAGTGIGLAICEKVAQQHGGAIIATSQPGRGATFSLYLPALSEGVPR
jgi:PAS domain S-box-containing protein